MPKYEPRILQNKTEETVEFMCGGRIYIYKPGEKRPEEGFVAHHALTQVNTNLTDVTSELDTQEEVIKLDTEVITSNNELVEPIEKSQFSKYAWKDLLKMAGKYKSFKTGMNRQEVEKLLEDETGRESQTLSGTSSTKKE